MRTCKECSACLPDDAFYASNKGKCKVCVRKYARDRARTNPAVQEYDRARAKTPKRRAHVIQTTKRWREKNPAAYRAQTAVGNAIRDGKLSKGPCAICGESKVHAHHKDYSKPLDVVWLCARCHHRLHAVFPELEGAGKAG